MIKAQHVPCCNNEGLQPSIRSKRSRDLLPSYTSSDPQTFKLDQTRKLTTRHLGFDAHLCIPLAAALYELYPRVLLLGCAVSSSDGAFPFPLELSTPHLSFETTLTTHQADRTTCRTTIQNPPIAEDL